jgi:hypothetical protein
MPKTKGNFCISIKEYIDKYWGKGTWDKFFHALSADDQLLMQTAVSLNWVDMEARLRIVRTFEEVLGTGNGDMIRRFAYFEAEKDLHTALRLFLRVASPINVLKKAGQIWRKYYDWGELIVEQKDEKSASVTLKGNNFNDRFFCLQLQAYFSRFFELVGAEDVKISHPECRAQGAADCVFVLDWE